MADLALDVPGVDAWYGESRIARELSFSDRGGKIVEEVTALDTRANASRIQQRLGI